MQDPRPNLFNVNCPGEGWLKVMCEYVCLFTALSLICLLVRDSVRGVVQCDIFFTGFLKATLGDSRKEQ
jgi:hypothetical protein